MKRWIATLFDPMIAILVVATAVSILTPATGELHGTARQISNISIFVLFLINGMRIARSDIAKAVANWRFFVPLMVFVFVGMAVAGTGFSMLAALFLPGAVALGFVFLAVLPSTVQSATSYTTLAGGNTALSVVGAALLNISGVLISAPLFALLSGEESVDLGSDTIIRIGTILLLPFVIGQIFQSRTRVWLTERKGEVAWLDRIVIGIAVYVAMSGAVEQGALARFSAMQAVVLFCIVSIFLALAYFAAWIIAGLGRYPRADRIAFLFAGPQKSVAIGAPLAAIVFPPALAGAVIVPLLLYHVLQLIVAAPLVSRLARQRLD